MDAPLLSLSINSLLLPANGHSLHRPQGGPPPSRGRPQKPDQYNTCSTLIRCDEGSLLRELALTEGVYQKSPCKPMQGDDVQFDPRYAALTSSLARSS